MVLQRGGWQVRMRPGAIKSAGRTGRHVPRRFCQPRDVLLKNSALGTKPEDQTERECAIAYTGICMTPSHWLLMPHLAMRVNERPIHLWTPPLRSAGPTGRSGSACDDRVPLVRNVAAGQYRPRTEPNLDGIGRTLCRFRRLQLLNAVPAACRVHFRGDRCARKSTGAH